MTRFRSTVAAVVAAGVLLGGTAFAQGPRGGPGQGRAGAPAARALMGGLPLGAVTLTDAQQDLIRDIRERGREEARQWQTRLREAQEAQRNAVQAIPFNEATIRAATQALADVQAEVAVIQARVQNEIFASLTAEQQAQISARLAERAQRMQQRQEQSQQRQEQMRQRLLRRSPAQQ